MDGAPSFPTADELLFGPTFTAQRTASDPRRSIWARANAGAGKTKVLVDRIARLLLDGAEPGRILGITYTKAAAAEMQTRLFEQLGRWTVAPESVLREELRGLDPGLPLDDARLRTARALFARALETPGGLKVQTIHAFCQAVLRRFPLEAGIPPGFDVADGAMDDLIRTQAWEAVGRTAPDALLRIAALTSADGARETVEAAAALLDGPEAGEHLDLAAVRAALTARLGADPAITEPRKHRLMALHRLVPALPEVAAAMLVGSKMDIEKGEKLSGLLEDWHAGDHDAAHAAMVALLFTKEGPPRRSALATKATQSMPAVAALLGKFDKEVGYTGPLQALVEAELAARRAELLEASCALTEAARAWQGALASAKRELGVLDFDDLLERTAALLGAGEGAAQWVLFKLDQGIDHVLLDEAQDTSPRQWDLLSPLLAALEEAGAARPRTRFVVGDEKQSIYSFQGARPDRFLDEERLFATTPVAADAPPRQSVQFDLSFRTGQTILTAVDLVWAASGGGTGGSDGGPESEADSAPAPLERKFAGAMRHVAFRRHAPGVIELWPLTLPGEEVRRAAWDMPLDVEPEVSARNRLAERIAAELEGRLARGEPVWERVAGQEAPRPLQPGDVMILVQRRGPLFHQIIRRLKARGIPVAGADRIRLAEDVAVQDLVALARFALCPNDEFNLACVLKGPFCGLTDDDTGLFPLAHGRGEATLWERLQARREAPFAQIAGFLADLVPLGGALMPYEFFATVLEQPLPDGRTGWRALIERLGREAREPVEALLQRALDHGRSGPPGLSAFLAALERTDPDVKRELDQGASGVRVMTVHGAKGLEAPLVILPDTTVQPKAQGGRVFAAPECGALIWSPDATWLTGELEAEAEARKAADLAESARLLYVAMTRARDRLILCGAWAGQKPKTDTPAQEADGSGADGSRADGSDSPLAQGAKAKSGAGSKGFTASSWYGWITSGLEHMPAADLREIAPAGPDPGGTACWWGVEPQLTAPGAGAQGQPAARARAPGPLPAWLDANAPPEPAPLKRIAPSALVREADEPAVPSPAAPRAAEHLLRGSLIHQLLQRLPDLPPEWRAGAGARHLERAGSALEADVRAAILDEVLAVMASPDLAPVFAPGSRAEVAITGTGPGLPPGLLVAGTVDRLAVTGTEVLVVDYKTNRRPPASVEAVSPVYLAQMAAYRTVLASAWPTRTITCALVWTDGPTLMRLPDEALTRALHQLVG
jgi:ATP-dependent helicase/nuclease subunit A